MPEKECDRCGQTTYGQLHHCECGEIVRTDGKRKTIEAMATAWELAALSLLDRRVVFSSLFDGGHDFLTVYRLMEAVVAVALDGLSRGMSHAEVRDGLDRVTDAELLAGKL